MPGADATDGKSDAVKPQIRHYVHFATSIYPLQLMDELHIWHDYKI